MAEFNQWVNGVYDILKYEFSAFGITMSFFRLGLTFMVLGSFITVIKALHDV